MSSLGDFLEESTDNDNFVRLFENFVRLLRLQTTKRLIRAAATALSGQLIRHDSRLPTNTNVDPHPGNPFSGFWATQTAVGRAREISYYTMVQVYKRVATIFDASYIELIREGNLPGSVKVQLHTPSHTPFPGDSFICIQRGGEADNTGVMNAADNVRVRNAGLKHWRLENFWSDSIKYPLRQGYDSNFRDRKISKLLHYHSYTWITHNVSPEMKSSTAWATCCRNLKVASMWP